MVAPLAQHATQANAVIVVDLDADPSVAATRRRGSRRQVFSARDALPEGAAHSVENWCTRKSPALAPLTVLSGVDTARIGLDVEQRLRHLERLRAAEGSPPRCSACSQRPPRAPHPIRNSRSTPVSLPTPTGACCARCGRRRRRNSRAAVRFRDDARYAELLFCYRARNWPDTLDAGGAGALAGLPPRPPGSARAASGGLNREAYFQIIAALRTDPAAAGRGDPRRAGGLGPRTGMNPPSTRT